LRRGLFRFSWKEVLEQRRWTDIPIEWFLRLALLYFSCTHVI
jgi:hypothetical protein